MVVSFFFKPSSLFSFVLLVVAFNSLSSCGGCGDAAASVVVVEVDVVSLVVEAFCFLSLAPSSFSAVAVAAAASLNFLHSLRCPPSFQCCS